MPDPFPPEPPRHGTMPRDNTMPRDKVWVRRCSRCGRDDLAAAFGQPAMIEGPWSCAACGSAAFTPVRLALPGPAEAHCPYRAESA